MAANRAKFFALATLTGLFCLINALTMSDTFTEIGVNVSGELTPTEFKSMLEDEGVCAIGNKVVCGDGNFSGNIAVAGNLYVRGGTIAEFDANVLNDLNILGSVLVSGDSNFINISAIRFYGGTYYGDASGLTGGDTNFSTFADFNNWYASLFGASFTGDVNLTNVQATNFFTFNALGDSNFVNIGFSGYIYGDGSKLTGISASSEDTNWTTYWGEFDSNLTSTSRNYTVDMNFTNIQADSFFSFNALGDSNMVNLGATNVYAIAYYGDGSNLTGILTYADANAHYVPYVDADFDVNLGVYGLTANDFNAIYLGIETYLYNLGESFLAGDVNFGQTLTWDSGTGQLGISRTGIEPHTYSDSHLTITDNSGTTVPTLTFYDTEAGLALGQALGNLEWYQTDASGNGPGIRAQIQLLSDTIGYQPDLVIKYDGTERFRFKYGGSFVLNRDSGVTPPFYGQLITTHIYSGSADANPAVAIFNLDNYPDNVANGLYVRAGGDTNESYVAKFSSGVRDVPQVDRFWINGLGNSYFNGNVNIRDDNSNAVYNDKLVVDGNISSTADINAAGDIYYGGALVSYSPAIFCDAHSNTCFAIDFETQEYTWCTKENGEWTCNPENTNIEQKLARRDSFKETTAEGQAGEKAKIECEEKGLGWVYSEEQCTLNLKLQCEATPYNYYENEICKENPYLKCLQEPLKSWNNQNMVCEDDQEKIVQQATKECENQQDMEYTNGECIYSEEKHLIRLAQECQNDRSKYWNGETCINASMLSKTG